MEQLKLTIKPKYEPSEGQCLNSSGYSVKVNDWELGRGVTDFRLEMSADKKPKATVTFTPDVIDVDEMMAVVGVQTIFEKSNEEQEAMKNKHIERYISLRQALTPKEWKELDGIYNYLLYEKERNLTKDLTLNESEIKDFRKYAQKLSGINE